MAPLFSINPDGWLLHLHQGLFLFSPPKCFAAFFGGSFGQSKPKIRLFHPGGYSNPPYFYPDSPFKNRVAHPHTKVLPPENGRQDFWLFSG